MTDSRNPPSQDGERAQKTHRETVTSKVESSGERDTGDGAHTRTGSGSPSNRANRLRDAIRNSPHITAQRWYVLETVLLIAPYPLFVFVYLSFPIGETVFLTVTLLYSIFAMYIGFVSRPTL